MIRRLLPTLAALLVLMPFPAKAQTPVTVPLGSITLPPPPPATITPVTVVLAVTVNGVPMQANLTVAGTVSLMQSSGGAQYQLLLTPPTAPLVLTQVSHVELPDPQPWLFISGFAPVDPNDTTNQIKAGNRILIYGHHFGDQDASCRVEVNTHTAMIVSWLDTAIVAETPLLATRPYPASVLVWHGKDAYDLSMVSFTLVPAG